MTHGHCGTRPVFLFSAWALSLSVIACSVGQAQSQRPLTIPVKPTGSQQSATGQPLPARAELRRDPRLGTLTFLKAPNLSERLEGDPDFARLQASKQAGALALAFIHAYRADFRLIRPADELQVRSVETDALGLTHIRLRQTFQNIPVWAAELVVHLNADTQVYLVQGRYIPTPRNLSIDPDLTKQTALQRAADHLGQSLAGCLKCQAELVIFAAEDQAPRLAYRVLALLSITTGWEMVIDARTGAVLQQLSAIQTRE